MSEFIKFFNELSKASVKIAGGKGASLGEMTRAGIPVPSGFVVTAAAFDRFLQEMNLKAEIEAWIHKVNYKDVNSVDRSSNTIRDLIHDARMPEDLQTDILEAYKKLHNSPSPSYLKRGGLGMLVAVRSSATAEDSSQASWAGELESYLNSTEKILLGRVKDCWSSLFTPRAIVYRDEKGMRKTSVSVAVVVQKMVQSEIAGVCFTVHPVTKHRHQMIIEACWGLGEALVGGEITPDSYVIDKRDWSLMDVAVSEQGKMRTRKNGGGVQLVAVGKLKSRQKLNGKQIVELAKLCGKIEKHYKFPCDIEWALEKGKFYIVQSRPITTL
ncbi:MAG: PEP/pyruvate-binding domain-containing protein [bacterium]|nr:PEP/pyruvate-binding domain-containing protein [bacterium]